MSKTTGEIVKLAVQIIQQNPKINENDLVEQLKAKEVEKDEAEQTMIFVPIAFSRALFRDMQVPDSFILTHPNSGQKETYRLSENPFYTEALNFAWNWESNALSKENYYTIVGRSSEFKAVNQALHNGSKLENLVLSAPIIGLWWKLSQPKLTTDIKDTY